MARITESQYNERMAYQVKQRLWKLMMKSFVKLFAIIFVVVNFTYIYPMISLVVLFAAYFSMPTSYSTDQPWKSIEAWMRLMIGFFIAALLWSILTFDGSATGFTQVIMSFGLAPIMSGGEVLPIYLIILAFFCTMPKSIKADTDMTAGVASGIASKIASKMIGAKNVGKAAAYIPSKDSMESVGNILFIILMLLSGLIIFQTWLQVEALKSFAIMFGMFWCLCFVSGWMGGREGRPYVGVMMLVIALFIFSFAYTGTAGSAVFGQYWPTVEHYGSIISDPIIKAMDQANQGISDAWLMMTCPTCYYEEQQKKLRAQSDISEEATKKTIELTQFRAVNYNSGSPKIDPSVPLIGSIIIENQGTFKAENIKVNLLDPKIKNVKKTGAVYNGDLDCYEKAQKIGDSEARERAKKLCTYTNLAKDKCRFYACPSADKEPTDDNKLASCTWLTGDNKVSVPGDKKLLLFICGDPKDFSKWTEGTAEYEYVNQCSCKYSEETTVGTPPVTKKKGDQVTGYERVACNICIDKGYIATYNYADYYLSTIINYGFNYIVDVQTPVTIMDSDVYMDKLVSNEIKPKSVESKYNGGPAMISIWLQDQPLRAGETSYGTATITNTGVGKLMNGAIFTIKIPKEYVEDSVKITSHTRLVNKDTLIGEPGVDDSDPDYYIITAKLNAAEGMLKQNEMATFTFSFKGKLTEGIIDKSALLLGDLDYRYETDKRLEFPIIKVPIQ